MLIRNVNCEEIKKALKETNKIFNNNIRIYNVQKKGVRKISYRFQLKVHDSYQEGHRISQDMMDWNGNILKKGRRLSNACWHVHGVFFDKLLEINPETVIIVTGNQKIDKHGGNWMDRDIGIMRFPMFYSDACECQKNEDLLEKIEEGM